MHATLPLARHIRTYVAKIGAIVTGDILTGDILPWISYLELPHFCTSGILKHVFNINAINRGTYWLYLQGSGTKVDITIQSPGYPEYYTGKSCVCTLTTSKDQDRVSFHYRFNSWRPTDKVGISFVFTKFFFFLQIYLVYYSK